MFMIYCLDKPDGEDLRSRLRSAHIAYLEENKDKIVLIGPTLNEAGHPNGMVLILDVPSRDDAQAFLRNEPFVTGGLFGLSEIHPWRAAMGRWLPS